MKEIWVEKYRPTTLDDIVGQDEVVSRLKAYVKAGNLPHLLFAGPAGTGKTYRALELARALGPDVVHEIVQFHPSYTYEEFVVGIKPFTENGQVTFAPTDGAFKQLCDRARSDPNRPYVMTVDEINRGNIPKIFGELLFALEYRNEGVRLPYLSGGEAWKIPENVYLIGTMNTADRSIALIDVALRRRFYFIEMRPDYELLEDWLRENASEEMANIVPRLLGTMNARITRLIDQMRCRSGSSVRRRGRTTRQLQRQDESSRGPRASPDTHRPSGSWPRTPPAAA